GGPFEPDGVSPYRLIAVRRHVADYGARIDAARQERSNRHVAHHLHAHRLLQPCAGLLYPVTLAERTVSHLRNAPVAALLDAPALDGEQARRGQLRYAPKDRLRRRDVAEIEIGMQRRAIDFRRDARQREERFRLGRERDPARIPIDVDRLDAQAVASDHEAPPA